MLENGSSQRLYVFGHHKIALFKPRKCARCGKESKRRPWPCANPDGWVLSCLPNQTDDVAANSLADAHTLRRGAPFIKFTRLQDRSPQFLEQSPLGRFPLRHELRQFVFVFHRRIAHTNFYKETVFLGLRERIRALMLDGVLRRKNDEDRRQSAGLAINRHLPFL